ncbi:MAG: hypothetical protein NVS1B10_07310 [Candidatus Saccharimonadales bacterium]
MASNKNYEGSVKEENSETAAFERKEDGVVTTTKTTKPMAIRHTAGCGSVGHAGKCPVQPQEPIGVR